MVKYRRQTFIEKSRKEDELSDYFFLYKKKIIGLDTWYVGIISHHYLLREKNINRQRINHISRSVCYDISNF